jgi:hypothetical protein
MKFFDAPAHAVAVDDGFFAWSAFVTGAFVKRSQSSGTAAVRILLPGTTHRGERKRLERLVLALPRSG